MGRGTIRSRRRRMVEGSAAAPLKGRPRDELQNTVEFQADSLGRQPDNAHAMGAQPCCSTPVMVESIRVIMAPTIDFNSQLRLGTVEVEDEGSDRLLPPKLQTLKLPAPEASPETRFGRRQSPAKLTGPFDSQERGHYPSTASRSPSPFASRTGRRQRASLRYRFSRSQRVQPEVLATALFRASSLHPTDRPSRPDPTVPASARPWPAPPR